MCKLIRCVSARDAFCRITAKINREDLRRALEAFRTMRIADKEIAKNLDEIAQEVETMERPIRGVTPLRIQVSALPVREKINI